MSEAVKLRLLRNGASSGGSLAVRPDAVAALKAKAVAKLKLESVDSDAIRLFDEKGFEIDDDEIMQLLPSDSIVYVSIDGAEFIAPPMGVYSDAQEKQVPLPDSASKAAGSKPSPSFQLWGIAL